MHIIGSSSSYDSSSSPDCSWGYNGNATEQVNTTDVAKNYYVLNEGNPDPMHWDLIRRFTDGRHLVVELEFPNCNNYEGRKIMVYRNITMWESLVKVNKDMIDPHFAENKKFISPFARFEPTDEGWKQACIFIENLK